MAYISEIHYQNKVASNTNIGEFVEVSLTQAELDSNLADDLSVVTYNPDGTVAGTAALSTITPVLDANSGLWVYQFDTITTAPDNNDPNSGEFIMLVNTSTQEILQMYEITPGATSFTPDAGTILDGYSYNGSTSTPFTATSLSPVNVANGESAHLDPLGNQTNTAVSEGSSGAPCFTSGTRIETPEGFKRIDDLRAGDFVLTKDAGQLPIVWIGKRTVGLAEQIADPKLRPVIVPVPGGDELRVSRQHRLLVTGKIAERMFGQNDILVPAKDLIGHAGVHVADAVQEVTYVHLLLDGHHLVNANGVAAESLYLGTQGINAMTDEAREELQKILPEITSANGFVPPALCRDEQKGRRAKSLAARFDKNDKQLVTLF